jgi:hypothetical protein
MDNPASKALYREPEATQFGNGGTPEVANKAALPAGGNATGDVCVVTNGTAYVWDGGSWVAKGRYNSTPEWVREYDFGAAIKADIKAAAAGATNWGDFKAAIAAW